MLTQGFGGSCNIFVSHALFSTCEISSVTCLKAELKSSKSHKDISDFYLQSLGRMCRVCPSICCAMVPTRHSIHLFVCAHVSFASLIRLWTVASFFVTCWPQLCVCIVGVYAIECTATMPTSQPPRMSTEDGRPDRLRPDSRSEAMDGRRPQIITLIIKSY